MSTRWHGVVAAGVAILTLLAATPAGAQMLVNGAGATFPSTSSMVRASEELFD